jgi:hypothetical protein
MCGKEHGDGEAEEDGGILESEIDVCLRRQREDRSRKM